MREHGRGGLFRKCLLMFCLGCLSPAFMAAQTATGGINGTITDQTGASIAGATITLTSESTGAARTLTASSAGTYALTSLEPGDYDLRVSAAGFQGVESKV